ncbi:adrenodoxin, mitochondrial [Paramuricea clavata]|uniref:Adrenodoxin, mitochondrial n=1 Tax=Paramuricea clavata TaxID=317549 RepID=A0A6S7IBW0_PARCT|nr:adrenodoxin, mitochondrial [Paramuricea clavata]
MAHIRKLASIFTRSLAKPMSYTTLFTTKYHHVMAGAIINVNLNNRRFCSSEVKLQPDTVSMTFLDRDGDKKTVSAKQGDSLLDVAKNNDIDLEGACEGTLSCSTCHLIFDPDEHAMLDLPPADDEELDMLDLAYGLTPTSRLGCQIEVTEKFEGITLKVPEATRDARDL